MDTMDNNTANANPNSNPNSTNQTTANNQNINPKKLTTCKSCGATIAKSAKRCPNCGAKNKKPIYKRVWFWILIVVILICIVGCEGTSTTTTTTTTSNGQTTVNTSVKDDKDATQTNPSTNDNSNKIYNIGDTVTSDNIELSITAAEYWTKYNSYLAPSEGKEIYRVYMVVKNVGKSDLFVTAPDCYADDSACEEYYYADDVFVWDTISTGRKAEGWVYYEVPKGAENIEIEYETSFWFDEYVLFKVK